MRAVRGLLAYSNLLGMFLITRIVVGDPFLLTLLNKIVASEDCALNLIVIRAVDHNLLLLL